MRILHLSDPHLVAADQGQVRGRPALAHFERALQLGGALNPDLVLVTGDLCQDESWGGICPASAGPELTRALLGGSAAR